MIKKLCFLIILSALTGFWTPSWAMNASQKKAHYHAIIMPGMNGGGGGSFRHCGVVNSPYNIFNILKEGIDFGQQNCIDDFNRQYQAHSAKNPDTHKTFHCVSQGTATVLNWLAQKTPKEQNETAKLVVLEGVLGNGNKAIMHTIENSSSALLGQWHPITLLAKACTYLPFARAWLPVLAKIVYPSYNPAGMQAIKSASRLSSDIPIVIMHNKGDFQTPINDARELYCVLKENRQKKGKDNTYLIETDNDIAHFDILEGAPDKIRCDLQAIYQKHELPVSTGYEPSDSLPSIYQPSIKQVKERIKQTNGYKNIVRNVIDMAGAALIIAGLWWKYKK